MSAVAETFEMPNVVDRTDAAAVDTLAEFSLRVVSARPAIEQANASPTGGGDRDAAAGG
jgi:beta-lactam-binding protein with PASTA domain